MKAQIKHLKIWLVALGCAIIILPLGWFLQGRLEGEKPTLDLDRIGPYVGRFQELFLSASDAKSGLRSLWVAILKDGKEVVLHDENFPAAGLFGVGKIKEASAKIQIEPAQLGFADGEAILRVAVRDYSWRGWWKGNSTYVEKAIVIDTRPPAIEVLSHAHNLSQGGAGLVVFRTSEICPESGVQVGDNFFKGRPGFFKDEQISIALIAVDFRQDPDTAILVKAADRAGNSATAGINYHIRRKTFRQDRINITDGFIKQIIPEFASVVPQGSSSSLADEFLKINRDLREANYERLSGLAQHSDSRMYWKGVFLRLPRSATRSQFADERTYFYQGREIDRQVHLGIDLASLKQSPVPAANSGVVVFADFLGIYGNTVLLDHGFGLFSMYSHLSQISAKPGTQLAKGDILGRTGSTGLAGGDHLHFALLVQHIFVNPVEWWDLSWIKNNILSKLQGAQSILQQE